MAKLTDPRLSKPSGLSITEADKAAVANLPVDLQLPGNPQLPTGGGPGRSSRPQLTADNGAPDFRKSMDEPKLRNRREFLDLLGLDANQPFNGDPRQMDRLYDLYARKFLETKLLNDPMFQRQKTKLLRGQHTKGAAAKVKLYKDSIATLENVLNLYGFEDLSSLNGTDPAKVPPLVRQADQQVKEFMALLASIMGNASMEHTGTGFDELIDAGRRQPAQQQQQNMRTFYDPSTGELIATPSLR